MYTHILIYILYLHLYHNTTNYYFTWSSQSICKKTRFSVVSVGQMSGTRDTKELQTDRSTAISLWNIFLYVCILYCGPQRWQTILTASVFLDLPCFPVKPVWLPVWFRVFPSDSTGVSAEARKRQDYLEWSEYFMAVAFLSAQRSKDPSSQV